MYFQYGGKKPALSLPNQVVLQGEAVEIANEYGRLFEEALTGSPNEDAVILAAMERLSIEACRLTTDRTRRTSPVY